MTVTYSIKRGEAFHKETEEYPSLEATQRGIQERIADPFSPEVDSVLEIKDHKGRKFELEWSAILVPAL